MSNLYVAHQGGGQDGQLYLTFTRDGSTWEIDRQVPTSGMSDSPSALFFNGRLYCFYQGSGENGDLEAHDAGPGPAGVLGQSVPLTRPGHGIPRGGMGSGPAVSTEGGDTV